LLAIKLKLSPQNMNCKLPLFLVIEDHPEVGQNNCEFLYMVEAQCSCISVDTPGFHSDGSIAYCTLADNPIAIIENGIRNECPVGMRIFFEDVGYLKSPTWCGRP
jgi:hypothetical protein